MDRSELVELLSADGLNLLDSLPTYDSIPDIVQFVGGLRTAGHSPGLVAAVLSQAKLRARAQGKFGEFAARMLFTEAGLEQATRLRVASLHAGRFVSASLAQVADLGCGIGGDAMAMAALDLRVTAVEADEVTAAIASFNLAPFADSVVRHADVTTTDLSEFDAVFLDPARRTAGHTDTRRKANPADYSPSLDFAFDTAGRLPTGIKLGPGLDRDLIPDEAEAQWVSVDGQLVETGLWFGPLARPGVKRAALILNDQGGAELTAAADSEDVGVGELGQYLYEPNGAIIRARLIGDLARELGAHPISEAIAYLSSNTSSESAFATGFRVLETFALDERTLKQELRARGVGILEIKKRGVDIDPAVFRKRLNLRGPNSGSLVLTRVAGRHTALLVERL